MYSKKLIYFELRDYFLFNDVLVFLPGFQLNYGCCTEEVLALNTLSLRNEKICLKGRCQEAFAFKSTSDDEALLILIV
jgi:hypothetical protein